MKVFNTLLIGLGAIIMYKHQLLFSLILFQLVFAQSPQEIKNLKNKYENMKRQDAQNTNNQLQMDDFDNINPSQTRIAPYFQMPSDTTKKGKYYFGYDFFVKRDTIGFWENLSIPRNYLLGPGDEIVVSLWGETSLRQSYTISRSGKIYDEKAGILNISGKTLDETKKYLLEQFGRVYSTLSIRNASTFLDVSLGSLKSINVNFVGEVSFPGVYAIHPFSNVITGLIQAGGIDTTGSLRSIIIKRDNKTFKEIDLYNYLLKGDMSNNIQLRDQDIVLIKIRNSIVEIDSAVYKPGVYESIQNESIFDLINYAGGLKPNASGVINIERINRLNKSAHSKVENQNFYINFSESKKIPVKNGDKLTVDKMLYRTQKVYLIGQVKSPGSYNFFEGMKLKELLMLGSGFSDTTFMKSVYKNKAEIVRREPLSRYEKVIYFNLEDLLNGNDDYTLENLDKIVIHSNLNYFEKENVVVKGEVGVPGSYPLLYDNESLESLISRAGGLTSKALNQGISVFREVSDLELENQNSFVDIEIEQQEKKKRIAWRSKGLVLMPGDSIHVKESTNTINIQGEVFNPGIIEFKKGKSINYYINSTGGLTQLANKKEIIVIYPNGLVVPSKWYSKPKVVEGSTIFITAKIQQEPFDVTQFATNWTSIISSMITAIVLSRQI